MTDLSDDGEAELEAPAPQDVAPVAADPDASDQLEDDYVDELPEDLDLAGFVGPHTFPNNNRRRIPAAIYLVMGAICIALWITRGEDSALVNAGTLWAGIGLAAFGAYGMYAGRTLRVEESDALVTASAAVGFPVGHAAAQMAWRGWWSRPVWRILCYSDENPPTKRGIVLVDGLSGEVIQFFAEENPEDWSALDVPD